MSVLAGLSREKLKAIGLSDQDVRKFQFERTRVGNLDSAWVASDTTLSAAGRNQLKDWLASNPTRKPFAISSFALQIVPRPARPDDKEHKLAITYRSEVDREIRTEVRPIDLRGPSQHLLYDISHTDFIDIQVESDEDDLIYERSAYPQPASSTSASFGEGQVQLVLSRMVAAPSPDDEPNGFQPAPRMVAIDAAEIEHRLWTEIPGEILSEIAGRDLFGTNTNFDGIPQGATSLKNFVSWVVTSRLTKGEAWVSHGKEINARLNMGPAALPKPAPFEGPAQTSFERAGRFQVLGRPDFRFDGFQLSYCPISKDGFAGLLGGSGFDPEESRLRKFSVENPEGVSILTRLSLSSGEIDFEGTFNFERSIDPKTEYAGWAWALIGPVTVIGFQPDPELLEPRHDVVILLPAMETGAGTSQGGVPYDVSEAALLNRPELFGDDPGSSCRPFDNPGRILAEKRFSTVLRVTQPYVEGAKFGSIPASGKNERPVDYPRRAAGPTNLIDYETDPLRNQAQSIAIGHILEQRVRYRSNGYSLGDVTYSMTLAPRQKRKIMKLDYARSESARRDELTTLADEVEDGVDRTRDYDNAVQSELNEWAKGSSRSSTSAAAIGAGFAMPGFVIGGGATTASAKSSSQQSGGRTAAASENQRLRDSIRRFGQSLRNFGSTVVTESEQSESIEAVSEVVQNINYTRSLSVLYYEILRHIRVDTEVAGVSECLFVPLPVRDFDNERIVKYAHLLRRYARGWKERLALRYPRESLFGFPTGHELPEEKRADQPLNSISGSIYLRIGLALPEDGPEAEEVNKETDREVFVREMIRLRITRYAPFASYFPIDVSELVAKTIEATPEQRNRYFQRQIAPHMARRVLDQLTIKTNEQGEEIGDFTMVGDYRYGGTVRVDFTLPVDSITRRDLVNVIVKFDDSIKLPPKSFVDVKRARFRYANRHFRGNAWSDQGVRDLIDSSTGSPDASGAVLNTILSRSDELELRDVATKAAQEFQQKLRRRIFFFNKVIWWSLDRDEVYALLDNFAIDTADGRSLASMISRRPLGILGNMIIFKTLTDGPIDPMFKSFAHLKNHYMSGLPKSDPMRISLPTDGLYARAHLDGCVAAEEHHGSFDWVFDNQEPELADLPGSILESRRAAPQGLAPTTLPDTIINLQNAPDAPSVSGLSDAFGAVQNGNAFRDMAGLSGTQANARAAMETASGLATSFGGMAVQTKLAQMQADADAAKDIRAATAATQDAINKGMLEPADGKKSLSDFIERRLGNSGTNSSDGNQKLAEKLLELPGGGSVTTVSDDGVQSVVKEPGATEGDANVNQGFDYVVPDPMPGIQQPSGMSCWAAATTMLQGWRAADASPDMATYVNKLGEPYITTFKNDTGLNAAQKTTLIPKAKFKVLPEGFSSQTPEGYASLLAENGPIWITVHIGNGNDLAAHALILRGIEGSVEKPEDPNFLIIDPKTGARGKRRYSDVQTDYEELAFNTPPELDLFIQMVANDGPQKMVGPVEGGPSAEEQIAENFTNIARAASMRLSGDQNIGLSFLTDEQRAINGYNYNLPGNGASWSLKASIDDQGLRFSEIETESRVEMEHMQGPRRLVVAEKTEWKDLEYTASDGSVVKLPLNLRFLLAEHFSPETTTVEKGSSLLFPLGLSIERSITMLFGWQIEGGVATPLSRGKLDHTKDDNGLSDLSGEVVLALSDFVFCGANDVYSPLIPGYGGPALVERFFPLLSIWSTKSASKATATCELKRPANSKMSMMSDQGKIVGSFFTDRNQDLKTMFDEVSGLNLAMATAAFGAGLLALGLPTNAKVKVAGALTALGSAAIPIISNFTPSPRFDSIFSHISAGENRNGLKGISDKNTIRTHDTARKIWDRDTDAYIPTPVRKMPRQGAYDNIHMAPLMPYKAKDGEDKSAIMAPICEHDCLHIHWRWGAEFNDDHLKGWNNNGPYSVIGAPHIPLNQTLEVGLQDTTFSYTPTATNIPAKTWQVFFHHGTGFVVELQLPGQLAGLVELAESVANSTEMGAFYYHNQFHEIEGSADIPRLEVDVSSRQILEDL